MGVERVVAPGKLSFDLVDEFWYVAVVALLKELFEGDEDKPLPSASITIT